MNYTSQAYKVAAERAADALNAAGRGYGLGATAQKLAGAFYVVAPVAPGAALYWAYDVSGTDFEAVSMDYLAWRAATAPVEDLDVAVYFFTPPPNGRALAKRDGSAFLNSEQSAVLEQLRTRKTWSFFLSREHVAALSAARRLGLFFSIEQSAALDAAQRHWELVDLAGRTP